MSWSITASNGCDQQHLRDDISIRSSNRLGALLRQPAALPFLHHCALHIDGVRSSKRTRYSNINESVVCIDEILWHRHCSYMVTVSVACDVIYAPFMHCRQSPVHVQASNSLVRDDVHCGILWLHLGQSRSG